MFSVIWALLNGQRWLAREPMFLEIDRLHCSAQRKGRYGKPIIQGRGARMYTEVERYWTNWAPLDQWAKVDEQFADLQGQLPIWSIN
jgi:hypothetical protein